MLSPHDTIVTLGRRISLRGVWARGTTPAFTVSATTVRHPPVRVTHPPPPWGLLAHQWRAHTPLQGQYAFFYPRSLSFVALWCFSGRRGYHTPFYPLMCLVPPHQEKRWIESTKVKNIQSVLFGAYKMDAWYFSPYPEVHPPLSSKLWPARKVPGEMVGLSEIGCCVRALQIVFGAPPFLRLPCWSIDGLLWRQHVDHPLPGWMCTCNPK